jgi:hypothetical protein
MTDAQLLAQLDNKLRLVDDRVTAVACGYSAGLYLYGPGGTGKSYNIRQTLDKHQANYRLFNSRMTAKGLFIAMEKAPDAIHVLEDIERLTGDRDAQGLLRAALWAQPGQPRQVTWTTADAERRFDFAGGVIMLANRPLADLPELQALATRIAVHRLDVSDDEMAAQMRRIAGKGFFRAGFAGAGGVVFDAEGGFAERGPALEAEVCLEICAYVIQESKRARCPLDLRFLDNSCMAYLQWQSGGTHCHWHDLVAARIRQSAIHFRHEVDACSMEERHEQQRELVRQICAETEDAQQRLDLWRELTGRGKPPFTDVRPNWIRESGD